jgi:hypothetical protein
LVFFFFFFLPHFILADNFVSPRPHSIPMHNRGGLFSSLWCCSVTGLPLHAFLWLPAARLPRHSNTHPSLTPNVKQSGFLRHDDAAPLPRSPHACLITATPPGPEGYCYFICS